jgi:uncharacterized protein YidB (DUF937 family)/LysM repeat protein
MGLFDDIVRGALGGDQGVTQQQSTGLVQGLLDMFQDDRSGGLEGFTSQLQGQGLGDLVSSWVGTGQNRPIGADQLIAALGRSQVDALAQRAGISAGQGATVLAALLPALVDKLTPDGRVPQQSQLGAIAKTVLVAAGGYVAARAATSMLGGRGETVAPAPSAGSAAPRKRADFSDVQSGSSSAPAPASAAAPSGAGAPPRPGTASAASAAAGASAAAPQTYTVAAGDNLSKIAKRVYGDANQWRRIFEANRDQIKNPDLIRPGQVLRIP